MSECLNVHLSHVNYTRLALTFWRNCWNWGFFPKQKVINLRDIYFISVEISPPRIFHQMIVVERLQEMWLNFLYSRNCWRPDLSYVSLNLISLYSSGYFKLQGIPLLYLYDISYYAPSLSPVSPFGKNFYFSLTKLDPRWSCSAEKGRISYWLWWAQYRQ